MSILLLQSSRWGKERAGCFTLFVFLVSRDCYVTHPHDATGLSAICDCGISWLYSFTIFIDFVTCMPLQDETAYDKLELKGSFNCQHSSD